MGAFYHCLCHNSFIISMQSKKLGEENEERNRPDLNQFQGHQILFKEFPKTAVEKLNLAMRGWIQKTWFCSCYTGINAAQWSYASIKKNQNWDQTDLNCAPTCLVMSVTGCRERYQLQNQIQVGIPTLTPSKTWILSFGLDLNLISKKYSEWLDTQFSVTVNIRIPQNATSGLFTCQK